MKYKFNQPEFLKKIQDGLVEQLEIEQLEILSKILPK